MKNTLENILRQDEIDLLRIIFNKTAGAIKGVDSQKFRIDNFNEIELLNRLVRKQYILQDAHDNTYRISPISLLFLDDSETSVIFDDIDQITHYLREAYKQYASSQVKIKNIAESLSLSHERVVECLTYLRPAYSMGMTTDIMSDDAYVVPDEGILYFTTIQDLLLEKLTEWYPDAITIKTPKVKKHKNTEINARKREDVLGAALAAVIAFPKECTTRKGVIQGTKIIEVIEQKSPLFFSAYDDEPPLSNDTMTRLVNKYLRILEKEK